MLQDAARLKTFIMNNGQKILRWTAVLPGAIIAGIAITFVLHYILYFTLTKFVSPYPEFPERALTPFTIAATFIWAGCAIAPNNKLKVGIILFAIWIFLAGGFIMITLTDGKWFGKSLHFETNGVAPIMGIVGAFVGLYLVTKKDTENQQLSLNSSENKKETDPTEQTDTSTFYKQYGADIFSLIFISLFILCVYNTTDRVIIFSILLLFSLLMVSFTLRQKLYTTRTMKINLAKDIVMLVALIIGLLSKTSGLYVSIACLILYTVHFIWSFISTHIVGQNSTNAQH
jgi:hypothetical protein